MLRCALYSRKCGTQNWKAANFGAGDILAILAKGVFSLKFSSQAN